jgi:hypothetical protein
MTETFLPTQAFEVKQLMWDLANNNANEMDFYRHVRRMSFSIIMTSTYGHRIDRWDHEDIRYALESSKILGKISRAGTFIEDELPFLAQLPHWLQPSRKRAMRYAQPVLGAKMRLWNMLKTEIMNGIAPPCFGKELMMSDYRSQGLVDEDAAWIAGGMSSFFFFSVLIPRLMLSRNRGSGLRNVDCDVEQPHPLPCRQSRGSS